MRRIALLVLALSALAALASVTLAAGGGRSFPDRIDLPSGFAPEGIDIDHKGTFYVGRSRPARSTAASAPDGEASSCPRARARRRSAWTRTTAGSSSPAAPRAAPSSTTPGTDARSPRTNTTLPTFVNDVVARGGAYFTDSLNQVLYRIPIDRHGRLGSRSDTIRSPATSRIAGFNANGIDAARHGRRS